MSRNSLEWWSEVLATPGKLEDWLKRQYHSEASAVPRIAKLQDRVERSDIANKEEWRWLLTIISQDEAKHATQVAKLMESRGLVAKILPEHRSKYMKKFQELPDTIEVMTAVAAYAELTSLTRFGAILQHPDTPQDIRQEFTSILFEEEFHHAAFRRLAGSAAYELASQAHQRGLDAVGISDTN